MNLLAQAPTEPIRVLAAAPADARSPEAQLGRFHGREDETHKFCPVKQQPWHEKAAQALALGMSIRDVADLVDMSAKSVQDAMRAPFFQAMVNEHLAAAGADIMALFKAEAFASVAKLVELRDSAEASKTVQLASAKEILDRALGKPTQFIETTVAPVCADPVAEEARLLSKLARDSAALGLPSSEALANGREALVTTPDRPPS